MGGIYKRAAHLLTFVATNCLGSLVQEWCVQLHPAPPMALSATTRPSLALWLFTVAMTGTFSWDMETLSAVREAGGVTHLPLANVSPIIGSYGS